MKTEKLLLAIVGIVLIVAFWKVAVVGYIIYQFIKELE